MSMLLIDGKWVGGESSQPVINKYTGKPCGEMAIASSRQVQEAISGVAAGFEREKLSAYERYEILSKTAELVALRKDQLVETMVAESGFTSGECANDVRRSGQTLRLCAEEAKRITGELIPLDAAPGIRDRMAFSILAPRGVVCAITPFNSPLSTVVHKVAPALAAGNSVILKPAGYTPLTAVLLCKALLDAGLPSSLISLVNGPGASVGTALVADPRVDFYTFTGSTEVGLEIQRSARLRGLSLELGSISSTIVCHDANLDVAVPKVVASAFRKAGQVCTSTQRILVDRRILSEFMERLIAATQALQAGDPAAPGTTLGPMISLGDARRIEAWIAEAIAQGAEILTGGTREGNLFMPTILRNVDPSMRVVSEETFAPVVSVVEFEDFQWALDYTNNTRYGLAAGIFTSNLHTAFKAARQLRFGGININEASSGRVDMMPFGGLKDSGFGHEGPKYAIREMLEDRLVTISF